MRYSGVVQSGLSPQTSSSWEVSESWEDGEPGLREPIEEDPYPGFRDPWTLIAWVPHAKNLQRNRKPNCPNRRIRRSWERWATKEQLRVHPGTWSHFECQFFSPSHNSTSSKQSCWFFWRKKLEREREREKLMMGFYFFSRRRSSSSSLLYLLYHSFQNPFFYFLSEVIRVVGWWGFLQAYRIEFDTHSVGSWVWWQEIEGCIHMECWWCKPNLLHFPFTSSSIFFELLKLLPCWRNSILPFSWSCWMSFHAAAFIEVLLFGIERPWLSLPNFINWTLLLLLGNVRSWQWDHSIL